MDELQFQALVRRTRDKTQRRALANQQGGVEQEQPKLSRPLLRPESEVVELSKVSGTFPTEAPLVGSWPLGWSELPCVCVCFSWACGLERRAKEQLGSEDAQRTSWSPVSLGCSSKSSRRAIQ